jgi:hypothetical protein
MADTLTLSDIAKIGQRQTDTAATPKSRKRSEATVEVAQDSAPDLVLRRTCGRSRQLLVLMPTQNMYCVMNESTKETKPIDKRNISQFMVDGAKGYLPLPTWAGGSLYLDAKKREILIRVLKRESTSDCLRRRMVNYRTLTDTNYHDFDSLLSGLQSSDNQDYLVRDIIELVDDAKGAFQYLNESLVEHEVIMPEHVIEATRSDIQHLIDINSVLGVDNTRVVIDRLAERMQELSITCAESNHRSVHSVWGFFSRLSAILRICERTDALEIRNWRNACVQVHNPDWLSDPTRVSFSPGRLIEYIFDNGRAQGFDQMGTLMDTYLDTLNMQVFLAGSIHDKYPDNLLSYHQVLSSQFNRIQSDRFAEAWKHYAEMAKPFETECDGYTYIVPTSAADLAREAMLMSNCVRSYEHHILNGRCAIVFMRKSSAPEQSLVTLELKRRDTTAPVSEPFDPSEYQVTQAYQSKNRPLDEQQRKSLSKYLEKLGASPSLARIA